MQKWEYMLLRNSSDQYVEIFDEHGSKRLDKHTNPEEFKDNNSITIMKFVISTLNQYGKLGWEICGFQEVGYLAYAWTLRKSGGYL